MTTETDLDALPATAWAVLGVLSFDEELSGYDIKQWMDQSVAFFYWSPSQRQVYSELRRLEEHGLATSRIDKTHETRHRRLYRITELGKGLARAWVGHPDAETVVLKHPLILRVWAAHNGGPEQLLPTLKKHRRTLEEELERIEGHIANAQHRPEWAYSVIALEWAQRQRRSEIEHLDWLASRLASRRQ